MTTAETKVSDVTTADMETFLQSDYELPLREYMEQVVADGSMTVVVDAGAQFGMYTNLFARLIPDNSTIYAIEADPPKAAMLAEYAAKWAAQYSVTITVLQFALTSMCGKVKFYTHHTTSSGSLFKHGNPRINYNDDDIIMVDAATLDSLFAETKVDLIKVDIEGAEYEMLQGAEKIIEKYQPDFIIEFHPNHVDRQCIFDWFTNHKYHTVRDLGSWGHFRGNKK